MVTQRCHKLLICAVTNLLDYTAGSNKGSVEIGDSFNNPFAIKQTHNADANYTSERVVESVSAGKFTPAWGEPTTVEITYDNGATWSTLTAASDGSFTAASDGKIRYTYDNMIIPQNDLPILNVQVRSIPLLAKARRIAV